MIGYQDDDVTVWHGDCRDVLPTLDAESVDAVVTDPPYDLTAGRKGGTGEASVNLNTPQGRARIGAGSTSGGGGFMGKAWDATGVAFDPDTWRAVLRVLKPGGYLLAFGGSRTSHRLACAIEDAGFEIRDSIAWLYGSGFPKSLDVGKAIDKAAGADRAVVGPSPFATVRGTGQRASTQGASNGGVQGGYNFKAAPDITSAATDEAKQWDGWGTALKPAHEPIVVARKPLVGTVAANVLAYGTGALNIDGCRIAAQDKATFPAGVVSPTEAVYGAGLGMYADRSRPADSSPGGRWPANVVLDESQATALDEQSGVTRDGSTRIQHGFRSEYVGGEGADAGLPAAGYGGSGGASRFFPTFRYEAKAPTIERPRDGTVVHPTVKPLDLMCWLVRLVTRRGGLVLDPFLGSGTTAEACVIEGMRCVGMEAAAEYLPLIRQRLTKPMQVGLDLGGLP